MVHSNIEVCFVSSPVTRKAMGWPASCTLVPSPGGRMIAFADIWVLRSSSARRAARADSASARAKGRERPPKLLQNVAQMDRHTPSAFYEFGPFALDVEAAMLFRGGEPVLLGRRAVALLRLLLE